MMKKTVSPNRKTGRMIAKNLIILLVLTVVAFVSIWAWFTEGTSATADGINVNCATAEGIEIAVVESGTILNEDQMKALPYRESLNLADASLLRKDGKTQFLHDLSLTEITGDGIDLFRASLQQNDGIAKPVFPSTANPAITWQKATPQVHYISFDLYIRSKVKTKVYLEKSSAFLPNATTLSGPTASNKSTYGDYSRDCIIGATRFSVVAPKTADGNSVRQLLWIPRPDIYLITEEVTNPEDGAVIGHNYTIRTNVIENDPDPNIDKVNNNPYNHYYYTVQSPKSNTSVPIENRKVLTKGNKPLENATTSVKSDGKYQLNKNVEISELNGSQIGGYYYNHVTCNMWIEGEDPEAKLALVGGEFTMNLLFTTVAN